MFAAQTQPRKRSLLLGAVRLFELTFHAAARETRKGHGSAMKALAMHVLQTVIFVAAFYFMFDILGLRGAALRGDFILYIMTGIFLFMTHVKAVGAVVGADGPASPMMKHAPMTTMVAILSAALSSLYISTLSMFLVLGAVHLLGSLSWTPSIFGLPLDFNPIHIHDPVGAAGMFLLAWFAGCCIGLPLYALKPWFPNVATIATTIYSRVNMIASGKMFVVNVIPATMRNMFDWNPLFHIIDQCRGYTFINYNPRHTDYGYALQVALVFLAVGLMAEFYTRRQASASWSAGR